jgi:hypothetical protein
MSLSEEMRLDFAGFGIEFVEKGRFGFPWLVDEGTTSEPVFG